MLHQNHVRCYTHAEVSGSSRTGNHYQGHTITGTHHFFAIISRGYHLTLHYANASIFNGQSHFAESFKSNRPDIY